MRIATWIERRSITLPSASTLLSKQPQPAFQHGAAITTKQDVEEILAIEADLLRSEGVDPRWPGFPDDRSPEDHPPK